MTRQRIIHDSNEGMESPSEALDVAQARLDSRVYRKVGAKRGRVSE